MMITILLEEAKATSAVPSKFQPAFASPARRPNMPLQNMTLWTQCSNMCVAFEHLRMMEERRLRLGSFSVLGAMSFHRSEQRECLLQVKESTLPRLVVSDDAKEADKASALKILK